MTDLFEFLYWDDLVEAVWHWVTYDSKRHYFLLMEDVLTNSVERVGSHGP